MDTRQTVCFERTQVDGTCLQIRGQPISTDWILLTYTDITAHKRVQASLEEARKTAELATSAKSAFLADMSHEIRTPMNAILGLAYLLEQAALPDDATDLVHKIRTAGRSLLGVINDILDFSKIESGKLEIEDAPFRLADVLDHLATIMAASVGTKPLELVIDPPPGRTSQLRGDALRLGQVLVNLAGNAIKFTERGHVAVGIRVLADAASGVTLRFSVRDTGIGIPPEVQKGLFAPFAQGQISTTRRYGGTGLGLSICRRLLQLMGGELHLTSRPGQGSAFWFDLTFERSEDAWISDPDMVGLEVLIADDSAVAREALCRMVEGLGWKPTAVSSGQAAVQHMATRAQGGIAGGVLVLDWKMPDLDGLAAARIIRHELKIPSDPIVIMVTAYDRDELSELADSHLADAVLCKPVTASGLYNAVSRALRVRQGGTDRTPSRPRLRLAGVRILVVDDSEINREVALRIFAGEGAQVVLAGDGRQAVDWLERHPAGVDIVLMDVQMPVLNGYEATRAIRRLPALVHLPVVALTAGAFHEQQERAQAAGMTAFLAKPFDVDAAIALILRLAGTARANPQPGDAIPAGAPMAAGGPAGLPGLALDRGLAIWKDVTVYQHYLRTFVRDYGDVVDRLRCCPSGEATALAHKLKGAAGSLALDGVAAGAGEVDQRLRAGQAADAALAGLQAALATALGTIAQFAPPVPSVPVEAPVALDPGAMVPNQPILVVDDEPLNLAALDQILSPSYALVFAHNGAEALAAARKHHPELILLDIQMPGPDGYQVCRTLKQDPDLAPIPVIFLSSFTDAPSKVLAFEVGGSDYVPKPFSADEVLARIRTQLKVLSAERQLRESYERLKAVEALRDNLVHMMVHDLRSPLTAMGLSLQLLEEDAGGVLAPDALACLGKARKATRRMAQMVTTVLDLNKLEAGKMVLALQPCELAALLQEVVDSHRELAGTRRLVLEAPVPIAVQADRDLLFRVFQNLLSNAIKFTPEGKDIRIRAEAADGWAQVRVIDQGPGIPPQDRDRIFDKFGQLGSPGPASGASTGLGLAFCKLAVGAHRGALGVESASGEGACFLLRLPLGRAL